MLQMEEVALTGGEQNVKGVSSQDREFTCLENGPCTMIHFVHV